MIWFFLDESIPMTSSSSIPILVSLLLLHFLQQLQFCSLRRLITTQITAITTNARRTYMKTFADSSKSSFLFLCIQAILSLPLRGSKVSSMMHAFVFARIHPSFSSPSGCGNPSSVSSHVAILY